MKTFLTFTFALGLAACGGSGGDTRTSMDLAGPHTEPSGDLATSTGNQDLATASSKVGCMATIGCENACITTGGTQQTEESCIMACDANETTNGMQLESALTSCVETACPQQQDMSAEEACEMTVQSSGGTCYSQNMACNADT